MTSTAPAGRTVSTDPEVHDGTGDQHDGPHGGPKFVASRTLGGPLDWNATLVEGDAVEGMARLKDGVTLLRYEPLRP